MAKERSYALALWDKDHDSAHALVLQQACPLELRTYTAHTRQLGDALRTVAAPYAAQLQIGNMYDCLRDLEVRVHTLWSAGRGRMCVCGGGGLLSSATGWC